jgi:hypothetical protein
MGLGIRYRNQNNLWNCPCCGTHGFKRCFCAFRPTHCCRSRPGRWCWIAWTRAVAKLDPLVRVVGFEKLLSERSKPVRANRHRLHKTETIEVFFGVCHGLFDRIASIGSPERVPPTRLIPYRSTIFPKYGSPEEAVWSLVRYNYIAAVKLAMTASIKRQVFTLV